MRASNMSIKAAPGKTSQPRLEALGQPPVEAMPVDGGEDVKEGVNNRMVLLRSSELKLSLF